MAPLLLFARDDVLSPPRQTHWDGSWKHDLPTDGYVLESWSQGFLVGALVMMMSVTVANMTKALLHRLILVELILAIFHGTFCFMSFPGYGWYLSSTATLLYASLYLHNIIAWFKTRPFLLPLYSRIYIITFLLTTPYWILETYSNFAFFNSINRMFLKTRPLEALFRDPWWVFTSINLLWNIKTRYRFGFIDLIKASPRFGIMLASMFLSIVFVIVDVLYATIGFGSIVGINPYWKFALVFKCLCDTLILDDFASALEKIRAHAFRRVSESQDNPNNPNNNHGSRSRSHSNAHVHSPQPKPSHGSPFHSARFHLPRDRQRSVDDRGRLGSDGEKSSTTPWARGWGWGWGWTRGRSNNRNGSNSNGNNASGLGMSHGRKGSGGGSHSSGGSLSPLGLSNHNHSHGSAIGRGSSLGNHVSIKGMPRGQSHGSPMMEQRSPVGGHLSPLSLSQGGGSRSEMEKEKPLPIIGERERTGSSSGSSSADDGNGRRDRDGDRDSLGRGGGESSGDEGKGRRLPIQKQRSREGVTGSRDREREGGEKGRILVRTDFMSYWDSR